MSHYRSGVFNASGQPLIAFEDDWCAKRTLREQPKPEINKALWQAYNDTSRPFGHELVLYTLLMLERKEDYPWNRYRRLGIEDIYHGVI